MYVKHLATQYVLSHWMTAPEMTAQEEEQRTGEHPPVASSTFQGGSA